MLSTLKFFRIASSFALMLALLSCADDTRLDELKAEQDKMRQEIRALKQIKYEVLGLQAELQTVKASCAAVAAVEAPIKPAYYQPDGSELDDPFLGPKDSPFIIVAFGDFQSKRCREFFKDSFPALKKDFLDPGKIKFLYRDFPLNSHTHAAQAASIAHCAGEQGLYWQMFDLLLQQASAVDTGSFTGLESGIHGIDDKKLKKCSESTRYAKEIQLDIADGRRLGAKGAPGFFVGKALKKDEYEGVLIRGAQPYPVIKAEIEKLL